MPNLKKSIYEKGVFDWLNFTFAKRCKWEEKCKENGVIFKNKYLVNHWAGFLQKWLCRLTYGTGFAKTRHI